jgi:hypothetical protein
VQFSADNVQYYSQDVQFPSNCVHLLLILNNKRLCLNFVVEFSPQDARFPRGGW